VITHAARNEVEDQRLDGIDKAVKNRALRCCVHVTDLSGRIDAPPVPHACKKPASW
jgi:hypothetical protein